MQTEIAETIVADGVDYLLAVKKNQGHLFEDIQPLFAIDIAYGTEQAGHGFAQAVNKGHCRLEIRECWVTEKEEYLALGITFYLTSIMDKKYSPQRRIVFKGFLSDSTVRNG